MDFAKNKSISFYTLGCRLNQSETAVIENTFKHDGYDIVDFNEPADYVVINTCTVTENGDSDTRRLVNKVTRINPQSRIALIGCQAQVQKEKLLKLPNVQLVVGNEKKMDLTTIINQMDDSQEPQVITPTISRDPFTIPVAGIDRHHTRANLKIQDGCDFFCSFCEIPYARGRARSRQFEDILLEAGALVAAGHKELVLTGINLGTYKEGNKNFLDVIDALEQIEDLLRIRISSIEPTTIPNTLIQKMASDSKLCRYLHIPLQNGSDVMLSAMKRKYKLQEFDDFINQVFKTVPEVCIGTDIIVGFPGETDEHFAKTEQYLRESPIHYAHVFSYSNRNMAKSFSLENQVPKNIISERSKVLRDISFRKRHLYLKTLLNTTQHVLFEQEKDNHFIGLTDHYARIFVQSEDDLSNQFLPVQLERVEGANVFASLVK